MKKPQCPKCINPDLAKYYPTVSKMVTAYIRIKGVPRRIGFICPKCIHFLPGPGAKCIQKLEKGEEKILSNPGR